MDQHPQTTFLRPSKASKALVFIDPKTGDPIALPSVQKPNNSTPASLLVQPPTKSSRASSRSCSVKAVKEINAITSAPKQSLAVSGRASPELDAYARPFIPKSLTSINELPGPNFDTPPVKQLDFRRYIEGSLPDQFLPPSIQPTPPDPSFDPAVGSQEHYEHYFEYHIRAELQAQQRQNASYALYAHYGDTTNLQIVSFKVPGLQENSPYIEVDDVVHRKNETLLVRLSGPSLQPREVRSQQRNANFKVHRLRFNVQFPVPKERFSSTWLVLPAIQRALRMVMHTNERQIMTVSTRLFSKSSISSFSKDSPQNHHWIRSMLFPTEVDSKLQTSLNNLFFSRLLFDSELNWEQEKAIESVRAHNYWTLPFLISGPPGTGKTKTLVELAIQLVKNVNNVAHILFCAPSDPAADTLVRLLASHFDPNQMFRLNRSSRAFTEVPGTVLPYCFVLNDAPSLPPFKKLMAYNIVVTTCRDASLLIRTRMTNSDLYAAEHGLVAAIHPDESESFSTKLHWTALLMDEAAQAMEPEALIPLFIVAPPLESVQLPSTPLFVMAGDDHQLGPHLSLQSSPLKNSLFARLFARPVYAEHPVARAKTGKAPPILNQSMLPMLRPAFANLVRNYRSHPAILAVPSSVFYNDTLLAEAPGTDRLASWSQWQGKKWPVQFHNNLSPDDMDSDGGGWFNSGEARLACWYAASLVRSELVGPKEVCIMSPFKAQVQYLRKVMRGKDYGGVFWDVDIGPTEIFQGLERGVVIICTTRSREKYVEKDKELGWGLIGMPNKMNVALTRAKFGLIVIGKKDLLLQDPNWKAFLEFCERNGLMINENGLGEPAYDTDDSVRTTLEKGLLDREEGQKELKVSQALGAGSQNNGMWTSDMQEPPNAEGYDFNEHDEGEYSENPYEMPFVHTWQ
ncbi:putative helicase [Lachnellula hyalina]|uniref:Putative helicase n=1 Tax=Lachnellula hyalina TaxID=1316788 RepID=A0A8H8TW71_9HELO|nr:putative helicase [Lachnellula hyalina]TVY24102.1 putative helicase [Lachnellula hyalina]